MTSGLGFLNKNGVVLAIDSKTIDEHRAVKSDDDQKLFRLDDHSGIIIAGYTPSDDPNNDLKVPLLNTIQQFWQHSPTGDARRATILRVLTENFCRYFSKLGGGYVRFILGDYDASHGFLLLKCELGCEDESRRMHKTTQTIYQALGTFGNDRPELFVRIHDIADESESGYHLGAVGAEENTGMISRYLVASGHLPQGMADWPLEKACQALEATICKIARDHPVRVNTNVRVATISKEHGFRWVRGEVAEDDLDWD